jgi:hypothetical protein
MGNHHSLCILIVNWRTSRGSAGKEKTTNLQPWMEDQQGWTTPWAFGGGGHPKEHGV